MNFLGLFRNASFLLNHREHEQLKKKNPLIYDNLFFFLLHSYAISSRGHICSEVLDQAQQEATLERRTCSYLGLCKIQIFVFYDTCIELNPQGREADTISRGITSI